MSASEDRAILLAGLSLLNKSDRQFAESLLRWRRPSEKQILWIGRLAERVRKLSPVQVPAPPHVTNYDDGWVRTGTGEAGLSPSGGKPVPHPDDIAMTNAEAEADRKQTVRDEFRKHRRRIIMEGM